MGTNIEKLWAIDKHVSLLALAPSRFRVSVETKKEGSQFPIVCSSGISICMTPKQQAFATSKESTHIKFVKEASSNKTWVTGQSKVEWYVYDANE